ncbi:MAG TPA: STAS/SEC14 domain-containing protein [Hymenobacter sp.]
MRIYYENRVGRLIDGSLGFARLIYHRGARKEDEFRAFLGHTVRLLARRGDGRLLVDQRLMTPFTPDEQKFVLEEWLPRTVQEGGYRNCAVVLAHDVFARLATATVITSARNLPLTFRHFDDEAEAIAWLVTT